MHSQIRRRQPSILTKLSPPEVNYYIKPPPGCPLSPKGKYMKVRKTLYGLKQTPQHWYEKAKRTLLSIGITQCPNAPCIFVGTIIPDQPPIYLSLYVDDFIYFSESPAVTDLFETRFSAKINVTFEERIGYFLGINHRIIEHNDGNIQIYLN